MTALATVRQAAREYLAELAEGMQVEACVVVHPGTPVADGAGGFTAGTPTRTTTTCQRSGALVDAERELASRLAIVRPMVVVLPLGTAISVDDEIEIDDDTLRVRGMATGTWAVRMRALCELVD